MQIEKLNEFNEWWFTGNVPADLLKEFKRPLFYELLENLENMQILAILGLRRAGKTTILYQLIQKLLPEVKPKNILYFSFDESIGRLDDLLSSYKEVLGRDFRSGRTYVFLDEIQKLDGWQNQLKKYYDLYPQIKFVISGSESLSIGKKIKETLAGRIYEFILHPLSLKEFLEFRGVKIKEVASWDRIRPIFREYILKGGFPEMVSEDIETSRRYVKSSVVDKVIFRDILRLSGIRDVDLILSLMELLATNPGAYLEYSSLANKLGRDRRVIRDYIMLLRESFLIRLLGNYRKGRPATLRKTKRAYLCDTGVISAFKPAVDDSFFARMVENAVVIKSGAQLFWKNGKEVDAVIEEIPLEVKFQNKLANRDFLGLREFMRKFGVKKAVMVTKNEKRKIRFSEGTIDCIPAWEYLLR